MNLSKSLDKAYVEARTRLQQLTIQLTESDLRKTLSPSSNSIGFLLQHIADVELLFSKNVFKSMDIAVKAKTVIEKKDSGEWTNLIEIIAYLNESKNRISEAIINQKENSWNDLITTNEFGTKSKMEAFGRIISHTAYHTGQIGMILKYGKIESN
ncbi:MAG: DinB family protein [Crocinitomicaceae bacterium]|jgi:uncharacterized damage-inducible protein DinB